MRVETKNLLEVIAFIEESFDLENENDCDLFEKVKIAPRCNVLMEDFKEWSLRETLVTTGNGYGDNKVVVRIENRKLSVNYPNGRIITVEEVWEESDNVALQGYEKISINIQEKNKE
jgi:hypothetical protein